MAKATNNEIRTLLDFMDRAYNKKSWHGTNLRGALKGLTIKQLIYRPTPERHNIWEIALHCAYWKYVVLRGFTSLKRGSFPRQPSNFPFIPDKPGIRLWRDDLSLLENYHTELRQAVAESTVRTIQKRPVHSKSTRYELVLGIASHDLYHAGQIQLLKRLYKK